MSLTSLFNNKSARSELLHGLKDVGLVVGGIAGLSAGVSWLATMSPMMAMCAPIVGVAMFKDEIAEQARVARRHFSNACALFRDPNGPIVDVYTGEKILPAAPPPSAGRDISGP
jgi:hypothetical protein